MTTKEWARAALSHPSFTGISRAHLGGLIEELAGSWTARCESALHERRGGRRKQQPGAGPKHDLVCTDRVLVTLVHLRTQLPHAALAELYGLERSTITRAIGEIRPLLAELPGPGQRVPRPGQRPAQEAEGRCPARRAVRVARDAAPPVLRADPRRTRRRRAQAVAFAATPDEPPDAS